MNEVEKINDLVFVLMAVKTEMDMIFEGIQEAGQFYNFNVQRIVDIPGDYKITDKILDSIENAILIIADLSFERPNVYFELGYARGKNKKIITIAKKNTVLHFDIKDWKCLFYSDSREIERQLKREFDYLFPNRVILRTEYTTKKKPISIREFLLTKNLRSDIQRTLAIGYYLEQYEKMNRFNVKDLEDGFRKAKESLPTNINDKVNKNIQKGYMMEASEMKDKRRAWYLTNTGMNFIERNLEN